MPLPSLRPRFTLVLLLLSAAGVTAQTANRRLPPDPPTPDLSSAAGVDIGAKVNRVFQSMPPSGGTIRIPAGTYNFATTIRLPTAGYHLQCDAGAVLHYTGTGDAILISADAVPSGANLTLDGEGGCLLTGNPQAANGVHIMPSNSTAIQGMRIADFPHGNGIALSGANTVQILHNSIHNTSHAVDMVTVPGYAPNAVHVAFNEISDNDWAVYSHDGHVPATRALGNVYRDNVFEGNHSGDLYLSWDAHTVVEGNYFESNGVGVAAGMAQANVYDIQVSHNYFTTGGYRSQIELGYGFGFAIEQNYEEGPHGANSGCAINVIPGPHGGTTGVTLRNAFSRYSERIASAHEFCYRGDPEIPAGVMQEMRINSPLQLGQAQIRSTSTPVHPGGSCSPEGTLLIVTPKSRAAELFFCTAAHWQPVSLPSQ